MKGHIEQACRQKNSDQQQVKFFESPTDYSTSTQHSCNEELYDSYKFFSLNDPNSECKRIDKKFCNADNINAELMFLNVTVNSKRIRMEIDTGVYAIILSEKVKNEFFSDLKLVNITHFLEDYVENVLNPVGSLENLQVTLNNKTLKLGCFVLPGRGPPLIGRQWLAAFGLWPLRVNPTNSISLHKIQDVNITNIREQLVNEFKLLFGDTPGLYNKGKLKIHLKENAKPIALKARHEAYAMKPLEVDEISRLVRLGHLVPVDVSEWVIPIVVVVKSDNTIRICGDFKLSVNEFIIVNMHPLPRIEDVFAAMQGDLTICPDLNTT